MAKIPSLILLSGVVWLLTACQTVPYEGQARDVRKKPREDGVIAIPVNARDEDRTKAESKMQANCSPGVHEVLEEGEVTVGHETKSSEKETNRANSERKVGSIFGMAMISGDQGGKDKEVASVTSAVKEWQISYRCSKKSTAKRH